MTLGPPIRKAPPEEPIKPDVQVAPHVWRRPDGTMYTRDLPAGHVAPRRKPDPDPAEANERTDVDFGGAC